MSEKMAEASKRTRLGPRLFWYERHSAVFGGEGYVCMGGIVGRVVVMSAVCGRGETVKPYGLVSKAGSVYDSAKA